MKRIMLVSLLFLALLVVPAGAAAQSAWLGAGNGNSVALEAIKASFADADDVSAMTSVWVLSGRFAATPSRRIVVEVPFSHAGGYGSGSNTLGNPYLGVEVGKLESGHFVELGLRAPLLREFGDDDYATGFGIFADLDRWEAFAPDATSMVVFGNLRTRTASGVELRLRGGPIFMLTDEEAYDDSSEVILGYGTHVVREGERGSLGAALTGRWALTSEAEGFGESTFHQLALFGDLKTGGVRPGLSLRLPLDEDLRDMMDYVIGIQVQLDIR